MLRRTIHGILSSPRSRRRQDERLPRHIHLTAPALQRIGRVLAQVLLGPQLAAHGAAHGAAETFHRHTLLDAGLAVGGEAIYDNQLYHGSFLRGGGGAALCQSKDNERMRPGREAAENRYAGAGPAVRGSALSLAAICLAALAPVWALICAFAVPPAFAQEDHAPRYNYPTSARADYVIGCLAANGFKREFLAQCACGIDVIADRMSYDDYEKADTILSMQQASVGPRGGLFRDTPMAKDTLIELRRAQAEANLRCGVQ